MLFARLVGPEHVVEQQLPAVTWREPGELQAGPVQESLPEPTDLRVDSEVMRHELLLIMVAGALDSDFVEVLASGGDKGPGRSG